MYTFLARWWHGEASGVGWAALVIGVSAMLSRLLGVLRDRLLASHFGAGVELDAYYAAFRLPDTLYNLLIVGALSAGFIPVFAEYWEKDGRDAAMRLAGHVLTLAGWVLAAASVLCIATASWTVPFIAPGFAPDQLSQAVSLSRIMGLSPLILGLSAVMGGVLQATKRFVSFSVAPILYNVGIIAGILFLSPRMGIAGVAVGVIIGASLHLLAQASVVIPLGLQRVAGPHGRDPGVRRILTLMIPRVAGLALSQVNLIVLLALTTGLATGSVAVFTFASNIQSLPLGVIGISFALAAFPALSLAASQHVWTDFYGILQQTLARIFYYMLPAAGLLILLRGDLVRLLLHTGRFQEEDAVRTSTVLLWFSLSLVAQGMIPVLVRAYYARQDTKTPLAISVCAEIATLALAFALKGRYGVAGIAMAFSVGACLQASLLLFITTRTHAQASVRKLVSSVWRSLAAFALAATSAAPFIYFIGGTLPRLVIVSIVAALVYLGVSYALRVPEARTIAKKILPATD